jgi:MFS family permease
MTEEATRFGPVKLVPGVSKKNVVTYLYASFACVALTSFVSVFMPYLLNVNLDLAPEEQGRAAGDLVFYGELILISTSGLFGAWSDQYGRRLMLVISLFLLALGFIAFGYANSMAELTVVRVFATFGIAGISVMIAAIQVDYPADESRGKLVGFSGIAIGLGAVMLGLVFNRLPVTFTDAGYSELIAGRYTLFVMAGICIFSAIVLQMGLVGGKPPHVDAKASTRELVMQGLAAARKNFRIALAYCCGFISRADLVVVGTFYSLWITQAGIAAGMGADEAAKTAGALFALVMSAALVAAPVIGWLNDRLDRTLATAVSLIIAAVGYSAMGLIDDPLAGWIYPASVLLGIGQMAVTLGCQTLLGQEAPQERRGAVVGTFTIFAAAGILFVTGVGGRLYDAIDPSAPFVMIGILNGLLGIVAFGLLQRK